MHVKRIMVAPNRNSTESLGAERPVYMCESMPMVQYRTAWFAQREHSNRASVDIAVSPVETVYHHRADQDEARARGGAASRADPEAARAARAQPCWPRTIAHRVRVRQTRAKCRPIAQRLCPSS